MKKFGEQFDSYEPLAPENIAIPEEDKNSSMEFFNNYGLKKSSFMQILPTYGEKRADIMGLEIADMIPGPELVTIVNADEMPSELMDDLKKVIISVAPTANVYQIPPDQEDLDDRIKQTLSVFDYYIVEMGLNVMLNKGYRIPELCFEVDLTCDKSRTDVTAWDIFPTDNVKSVQIISGKIGVSLTKMLEFIPFPAGKIAAEIVGKVLDNEIKPWEFNWSYDKYMIDAAGKLNYKVYWRIYKTRTVQGFNPTLTLKVRKGVTIVSAKVRAVYSLKSGLFSELKLRTSEKDVRILPV